MTEPSKHSGGRRKAEKPERRRAPKAPRAARVAEPREKVRSRRPARFAWARTTPGMIGIGVGVLVLAFVLRLVATSGGDDGKDGAQGPVGPALTTYGNDWKAQDGSSYRVTVTPIPELVAGGSSDSCVPAATTGTTNLRFTVRIDNRGTKPAPVPDLTFAVNTKASGAVSKSLSFEKASKRIDVTPTKGRTCAETARVVGQGMDAIAPQGATTFTGLIAGVRTPVGPGLTLFVRYTQADAGSPTGSSTADVAVLYPSIAN